MLMEILPPVSAETVFTCCTKSAGCMIPERQATIRVMLSVAAPMALASTIRSGRAKPKASSRDSTPLCSARRQSAICAARSGTPDCAEGAWVLRQGSPAWERLQWNLRGTPRSALRIVLLSMIVLRIQLTTGRTGRGEPSHGRHIRAGRTALSLAAAAGGRGAGGGDRASSRGCRPRPARPAVPSRFLPAGRAERHRFPAHGLRLLHARSGAAGGRARHPHAADPLHARLPLGADRADRPG